MHLSILCKLFVIFLTIYSHNTKCDYYPHLKTEQNKRKEIKNIAYFLFSTASIYMLLINLVAAMITLHSRHSASLHHNIAYNIHI